MGRSRTPDDARPESFRTDAKIDSLRVPPSSVESEQAVIGGLLLAPASLARISDLLVEADFYRRDHRLIYRAIRELAEKNKPFDAVTLGEWFEANRLAEQMGGASYLIELANNTPSAANIRAYADIVRDKALKRQLIETGTDMVNAGFEAGRRDTGELLAEAQTALTTLSVSADNTRQLIPADLAGDAEPIAPPRFVMAPYFPRNVVTLLGGHGGAGKSTLALILGAHVAAGRWWAGHKSELGKVTIFSLEDDARTVRYRLKCIIAAYDLDAEAVFANLRVFDWSDGDTALAVEKSEFGIHTLVATQLFARMKVAARGSDLVIIDNASDAFDGNENSKRQVRGFFHMLKTAIAQPNDAAVVLLAHIDKNAARYGAAGNSFSGSVAWHNSARSRLALVESKEEGLELRQEKANFGKKAEPTPLRMADHGVLMPCVAGEGSANTPHEGQDAAGVLAAIRAAAVAGTLVGTGRMGPGNAHQVLSTFGALPSRLKSAKGKESFWLALDFLVSSGRVLVEERWVGGKNRRRFLIEAGTQPTLGQHPPHPPMGKPTEPTGGSGATPELGERTGTNGTNGTNGAGTDPGRKDP